MDRRILNPRAIGTLKDTSRFPDLGAEQEDAWNEDFRKDSDSVDSASIPEFPILPRQGRLTISMRHW